jgi:hypothetical protein
MTQRAAIRQADVTRAVRGAIAAGLTVTGVHIDGSVIKVLTGPTSSAEPQNGRRALGAEAIEEALEKAREKRGKDSLLRRS